MNNLVNIAFLGLAALPLSAVAAAAESPDKSFYEAAAQGGLAEVEQGQLAQEKGKSQAVKDFGGMMVKDHTAANEKLKGIAARKGVELPTSPSMGQKATKTKLEVLSGETFDKSYIKGMVKDHKEDIEDFKKEAQTGKDPDAKAFAAATLPTLEKHLKKIESIAMAAGVSVD
jgi:putative membrane protein